MRGYESLRRGCSSPPSSSSHPWRFHTSERSAAIVRSRAIRTPPTSTRPIARAPKMTSTRPTYGNGGPRIGRYERGGQHSRAPTRLRWCGCRRYPASHFATVAAMSRCAPLNCTSLRQRRGRQAADLNEPVGTAAPTHKMPARSCAGSPMSSDDRRYRWLNDVVCVGTGEVRPERLLIDVAELIWEPPPRT
jgi:hypothetical protein